MVPQDDELQAGGPIAHLSLQMGILAAKVDALGTELRDRRDALERAVEFMTTKADKLEDRLRQVERAVAIGVAFAMLVSLIVPTVSNALVGPRIDHQDVEALQSELQNLRRLRGREDHSGQPRP